MGLGPWGTFNTAGNVREWVLNSAHTYALAMGGAWTDPPEMASTVFPTNPLDRSPQNGLRLMIELGAPEKANALLNPVTLAFEKGHFGDPIPDDEFEAVRSQFVADHPTPTHVDTKIVAQNDAWVAEEVTLMYAEAADKFVLYVVWPSVHAASLQAVIYAPSIGAFIAPAENAAALTEIRNVEFILRGGRALVIPVWSGAYERFAPPPANGEAQRKLMISWYRDLAKTLDYLKTRNDIDSDRIAIAGYSLGARVIVEPLIAIEGTLKTAVLISGGLQLGLPLDPAFEALNYAPRTVVPVLMINGQFDNVVPFAGQKAYFNALGTSAEDKRLVAFPNGHVDFPPNQEAAEVGDWLDKYLGPVGHNVVTNATQDQM